MIFDDTSDFSSPLATKTFATGRARDITLLNDTISTRQQFEFPTGIDARYIRWDVVMAVGNGYDGGAEMEFWARIPVLEPSATAAAVVGPLGPVAATAKQRMPLRRPSRKDAYARHA